jgi:hypothetical protein
MILGVFIAPLVLLTAEGLFLPLIEYFRSWFTTAEGAAASALPIMFFVKLVTFLILAFLGGVQLLMRLNSTLYGTWAQGIDRPHPLHVDYQPQAQLSMLSLLNWNLYRLYALSAPPLLMAGVTLAVVFGQFYLFNTLTGLPFISLPIQFIVMLFVTFLLGFLSFVALVNSGWNTLTTLFGEVVAVTEPDLPPRTIYERCKRIAFSSPLVYGLYPSYAVFALSVLWAVTTLLETYDIEDVVTFQFNWGLVLLLAGLLIGVYVALNYWKFRAYHDALSRYYRTLPPKFKERFSPPARA